MNKYNTKHSNICVTYIRLNFSKEMCVALGNKLEQLLCFCAIIVKNFYLLSLRTANNKSNKYILFIHKI